MLQQRQIDTVRLWLSLQNNAVDFLRLPIDNASQNKGQATARVPLFLNVSITNPPAFSIVEISCQSM